MSSLKNTVRSAVPLPLLSAYHFCLAYLGAWRYGFPSRTLTVIGITGTNGKSSTVEFINAILEEAGRKTALSSSVRVKVAGGSHAATGRSMPGRFFIQRFLREAVDAGCTIALIEMTSEGAAQHRHRGIELDALVFLNLAPEHIESHGSYEAYADAKYALGLSLVRSSKRPRIMVANAADAQGARYLALPVEKTIGFLVPEGARGGALHFGGIDIDVHLPGIFYVQNALAAAELARAMGIAPETIKRGIERVRAIPGRMQPIEAGQKFQVIVDYALTPDALQLLYKTFADKKKIAVFGSAGGGRDKWKRPILGEVADRYCESIILTNDIAYDENPQAIIADIARGMKIKRPEIIADRRAAIRRALELAEQHERPEEVAVLITGMGIDTEITNDHGSKVPWNDPDVAREEVELLVARYT